ncbi:LysM peptidoglycan-binding domain-containing protein [Sporolactobacillus shoreae]|uniref:LysM peptidoglycan-binding domain-containing protein n=1 Tax=Sporolactobacillus shoreae TaxID=1465501 RepID=UPI0019D52987
MQSWNSISDPNKIYVGQVLKLKPGESDNSETSNIYVIKSGDTLSGIAQEFNVTVLQLQSWNNISDPNKIYAGQQIIVYKNGGGTGTMVYTVKSGDTLSAIAVRFGVSVSNIQQWNNISDPNKIYAGETLKMYSSGGGGGGSKVSYTIRSGDTLSGIAVKFGVSVSQLQSWNGITDANKIYAGEVLSIYTSGSGGGGSQTYTVKSGDTLSGIAEKFGVTVSKLQSWNNVANPDKIYAGQVLVV